MNTAHHDHAPDTPRAWAPGRPLKIALLMIAVIAGFFVAREHWDHIAGSWVFLLLLACPLMHLFHGHGGHARHGKQADQTGSAKE